MGGDPEETEQALVRYELQKLENGLQQRWLEILSTEWKDRDYLDKFIMVRPVGTTIKAPALPAVKDVTLAIQRIEQGLQQYPPTSEIVSHIRNWFEQQLAVKSKTAVAMTKERYTLIQSYRQGLQMLDIEISEKLRTVLGKYKTPALPTAAALPDQSFQHLKAQILPWLQQHESCWHLETISLLQATGHPRALLHFLQQLQVHLLQEELDVEDMEPLPAPPQPPQLPPPPKNSSLTGYAAYLKAKDQQKDLLWKQQSLKTNQQKELIRKREEERVQRCQAWAQEKPLPAWIQEATELEKKQVDQNLNEWQQTVLRQRYMTHEVRAVMQHAEARLQDLNLRLLRNSQKICTKLWNQYLATERKRMEEISTMIRTHHLLSEKDVQALKQWMQYREELWKGRQFLRLIHKHTSSSLYPASLPAPK